VLEEFLYIDVGVNVLEVFGELSHFWAIVGIHQLFSLNLLFAVLLGELFFAGFAWMVFVFH
jgi:hypothetical protein